MERRPAPSNDERHTRAIVRAMVVLDQLAAAPDALGVSDIARLTAMSKGTVHLILRTLLSSDSVSQADSRYRLGPAAIRWGSAFIASLAIPEVSQPYLDQLRDLTGETTHIHIRRGEQRICVAHATSRHSLRREVVIGASRPLYRGIVGMVLMATFDPRTLRDYLRQYKPERLTPRTPLDPEAIVARAARTRGRGYYIGIDETELGGSGVAVPIFDYTGHVAAALAISGPTARWNRRRIIAMLPQILSLTSDLSTKMGSTRDAHDRDHSGV